MRIIKANSLPIRKGMSLFETIIVSLIMGMLLISAANVMTEGFVVQASYNKDIRSKQAKANLAPRLISKIREASIVYKSYIYPYIMIPVGAYTYYMSPEQEAVAVLVPKFDSNGNLVQPSANKTTFKAVAFTLLSKYFVDNNCEDDSVFVLLETNAEFDLDVKISDPLEITESLPIDWSSGESYIVGDNFKPASMVNLNYKAFELENDIVNFAFVPHEGYVYFPSLYGSENVDDSQYITSCKFRNYRG